MGNCFSSSESHSEKHATPSKVSRTAPTKVTEKPAQAKKPQVSSKGHKLTDDDNAVATEKIDPKEAARRAAEERFNNAKTKNTSGKLSKKLYEEQSKSARTHLQEQSQKNIETQQQTTLNYD